MHPDDANYSYCTPKEPMAKRQAIATAREHVANVSKALDACDQAIGEHRDPKLVDAFRNTAIAELRLAEKALL